MRGQFDEFGRVSRVIGGADGAWRSALGESGDASYGLRASCRRLGEQFGQADQVVGGGVSVTIQPTRLCLRCRVVRRLIRDARGLPIFQTWPSTAICGVTAWSRGRSAKAATSLALSAPSVIRRFPWRASMASAASRPAVPEARVSAALTISALWFSINRWPMRQSMLD